MDGQLKSTPLTIGLTTRHGNPDWISKNSHHYLNILAEYDATVVMLAPDAPATLADGTTFYPDAEGRLPSTVLEHLDGIIFSGGGDVDPQYFGQPLAGAEPNNIDRQRDELEIGLGQQALIDDLPILGICRGCQVLNVAAGGGMVQHFLGHRSPKESTAFHAVTIVPQSRLHGVVGKTTLPVNTFHHQGLDQTTLASIFQPVAFAEPDPWLIEAYESVTHRWVTGVQWHPERVFELEDGHRQLWDSFIDACRVRQKLTAAIRHRAAGAYTEARLLFEELLHSHPTDAQILYQYAWLHDALGEERAAVPLYEQAIANGLPPKALRSALLGLGSTYRTLGEYAKSVATLRRGLEQFPAAQEFAVFLSLALYNTGEHRTAMELLLQTLLDTTGDPSIQRYERALRFYADKLYQTWP